MTTLGEVRSGAAAPRPQIYRDDTDGRRYRYADDGSVVWLDAARQGPVDDQPEPDEKAQLLDVAILANRHRLQTGGRFILDRPADAAPIWGDSSRVAWAAGEPLMINGPTGVGKTTLAQQVVLARLGLRDQVLGLPVALEERTTLYIAADRPSQAARSFARMVTPDDRAALDEHLVVWTGPLPFRLTKDPELLAAFADSFGAGTVVIDSLKDVLPKPTDEEQANLANSAFQLCSANGVELLVLHHQRKSQGDNKRPTSIDDVYGNTFITAGMGSVLLVWGKPGDLLVDLAHLKQPSEPVGPWKLLHDHDHGRTTVQGAVDLLSLVRTSNGLTAEGAARAIFDRDKPDRGEVEKARRQLQKLVDKDLAHPVAGGRSAIEGRQLPTRYYAVETRP